MKDSPDLIKALRESLDLTAHLYHIKGVTVGSKSVKTKELLWRLLGNQACLMRIILNYLEAM